MKVTASKQENAKLKQFLSGEYDTFETVLLFEIKLFGFLFSIERII